MDRLQFVSKRLQAVVAALICLAFVQLLTRHEPPQSGVVRVAISR